MARSLQGLWLAVLLAASWCAGFSNRAFAEEPAAEVKALAIGDPLRDFESTDEQGRVWKSAEHMGKKLLVLYFYPGDFTGGCIKQAEAFREGLARLEESGAEVIGISGDDAVTHQLFQETYGLKHTLLADPAGALAKQLGIPVSGGGRVRPMDAQRKPLLDAEGNPRFLERKVTLARWTLIVGTDGTVLYKNTKVQPAEDAKRALAFIETRERESPAIAGITSHGGKVAFATDRPGQPAISVAFIGCHMKPDDVVYLELLRDVESVSLRGASIVGTQLVHLNRLDKLHTLDLQDTKMDDDALVFLREFTELRTLNLASTHITDRGLAQLKDLVRLESLDLNFTFDELTDEAAKHLCVLKRLKTLDLSGSKISDAGLECLKGLTALEMLNVESTLVTERGIEDFQKSVPQVKVIR